MGDKLEFEGEVINSSKGIFNVKVNDNYVVLCTLSGKIRQNSVNILVGDIVRIEVSEYDTTRGRITYRVKK
jgi:translation initiation factor IF-1